MHLAAQNDRWADLFVGPLVHAIEDGRLRPGQEVAFTCPFARSGRGDQLDREMRQ